MYFYELIKLTYLRLVNIILSQINFWKYTHNFYLNTFF